MDEGKRNIPISLPFTGEDEWLSVREPIFSGWLTSGPKVREFERLFAERHKVKHAIAVTSATTALHLSMISMNVKEGDEVIVPAFTWVSTANVVLYQGATVVFADIDPKTFNMNPVDLRKRITKRTKAIIPVHLFGLAADMDAIKSVAGNIPLIEDGACAAGSGYKGIPAGGLAKLGCFSFHPRKSITTGEGGMVTTNDDGLAELIKSLRNHGASISEEERHLGPKPFILPEFNLLGYNYRMTDLQAAVGIPQLKKLDRFIDERDRWANYYKKHLSSLDWMDLPVVTNDYRHGWQSFVVTIDESKAPFTRNEIMERLQKKGISTRPGTHAVHMLGYYRQKYGLNENDFPAARDANNHSMAIPLHNRMSVDDYDFVIHELVTLGK